jgi:hypothetical protein
MCGEVDVEEVLAAELDGAEIDLLQCGRAIGGFEEDGSVPAEREDLDLKRVGGEGVAPAGKVEIPRGAVVEVVVEEMVVGGESGDVADVNDMEREVVQARL